MADEAPGANPPDIEASSRRGGLPLSLYLHFPWCVRKCPYCDFNSHPLRGEVPEQDYLDALLRDLDFELAAYPQRRPVGSMFLGGGTPSLFSGAALGRLLERVARRLEFAPDIEVTLEANPGAVDAAHFAGYREAGINRISIGVQSFNATHLRALGRIHGPDEAVRAFEVARDAGFDNINLDLMYALPEQGLEEAAADLHAAFALCPEHLSYYQLTLEPNTEFHARPPPLPDEDLAFAMHEQGERLLAANGYLQYEVSAYARPDRQCRHNRNYWEFGDYLGIGAGAHGKLTVGGRVVRRARHRHPRNYMRTAGTAGAVLETREVPAHDLPFEFAMNALRLTDGRPLTEFEARTGLPATRLEAPLDQARRRGWLDDAPGAFRASPKGRTLLNPLVALFLPEK